MLKDSPLNLKRYVSHCNKNLHPFDVSVEVDEVITQEDHSKNQAEADKMDTTIQMPEPSQYMDAEAFAAEQARLRENNSKANNGKKTLMVSHW